MKIDDQKPVWLSIEKTGQQLEDEGYTYNESTLTYNSDVTYGGVYGEDGPKPQ
jgi:hypothetical protein